ncbi:MAG: Crp/Fnr family transcriptional regulator [Flavobacteriales bacterium]|nr:Crp/Fnr family transcriptional regulator [Flavobacteriales bacterium]MCB9172983.1 Crp/Fnr family transcriptional regulator [Flavobacteriales bacterium]
MTFNKNQVPSCTLCQNKQAGSSIFCCLTNDELDTLSQGKRNMTFKRGQVIFSEGNQPHGIYCIHSGKVKIHKLGDEGKEQIVRLANTSNIIGYRSVLNSDSYFASATALEDTEVCFISKPAIINLIKTNSNFSFSLMDLLSDDLKRAEEKITHMAQKHVRERIAEAILLLHEAYGLKEDNKTIDSNLTRKEIANIAGTTTETSIRILSEFHKDKIIELDGKDIKILDLKKLFRTANIFD